jgi:tetratricopeptide (TPR) repeat protein
MAPGAAARCPISWPMKRLLLLAVTFLICAPWYTGAQDVVQIPEEAPEKTPEQAPGVAPAQTQPQTDAQTPVSRVEILARLALEYPPSYVGHLVRQRGTDFAPTPIFEDQVRRAGGAGNLTDALQSLESKSVPAGSATAEASVDQLAVCAELAYRRRAEPNSNECRDAVDEDPGSAWPILVELRLMVRNMSGPGDERIEVDEANRAEYIRLAERARSLPPTGSAAAATYLSVKTNADGSIGSSPQIAASTSEDGDDRDEFESRYTHPDIEMWRFEQVVSWMGEQAYGKSVLPAPDAASQMNLAYTLEHDAGDLARKHAALAADYFSAGRFEESKAEAQKAVSLEPDVADSHLDYGYLMLSLHEPEGALAEFRTAQSLAPDYTEENLALAGLLETLGRTQEAKDELQSALSIHPDDIQCTNALVDIAVKHRDRKTAIDALKKSLIADGTDKAQLFDAIKERWDDQFQLAELLRKEKRFDEAAQIYQRLLWVTPTSDPLVLSYSWLLAETHGCDGMSSADNRGAGGAQSRDGSNAAVCKMVKDDAGKTLDVLKQNVETATAGTAPGAMNNLAWFYCTIPYSEMQNRTEALRLARLAVEATGGDTAFILDTLAEAQLVNGRATEALATEEKALAVDPDDIEMQERMERFRDAAADAEKR